MKSFNRIKTKNTNKGVQIGTCLIGNKPSLQYLHCFWYHHPNIHQIHNYSLSQWFFTGISKWITIACLCLSMYFLFSVISSAYSLLGAHYSNILHCLSCVCILLLLQQISYVKLKAFKTPVLKFYQWNAHYKHWCKYNKKETIKSRIK